MNVIPYAISKGARIIRAPGKAPALTCTTGAAAGLVLMYFGSQPKPKGKLP